MLTFCYVLDSLFIAHLFDSKKKKKKKKSVQLFLIFEHLEEEKIDWS
jgi:hypothetical protein